MPRKFSRNIANGVVAEASLADINPDKYEPFWVADPGEPDIDHRTGLPLGTVAPATAEGATANGGDRPPSGDPDRDSIILDAVVNIPEENYGKPMGGRPPQPKKAAVEAITGFKVTLEEIEKATATKSILGLAPTAAVSDAMAEPVAEDDTEQ